MVVCGLVLVVSCVVWCCSCVLLCVCVCERFPLLPHARDVHHNAPRLTRFDPLTFFLFSLKQGTSTTMLPSSNFAPPSIVLVSCCVFVCVTCDAAYAACGEERDYEMRSARTLPFRSRLARHYPLVLYRTQRTVPTPVSSVSVTCFSDYLRQGTSTTMRPSSNFAPPSWPTQHSAGESLRTGRGRCDIHM